MPFPADKEWMPLGNLHHGKSPPSVFNRRLQADYGHYGRSGHPDFMI
jgi:hypothetical protein